jgi:hypothetical protein
VQLHEKQNEFFFSLSPFASDEFLALSSFIYFLSFFFFLFTLNLAEAAASRSSSKQR